MEFLQIQSASTIKSFGVFQIYSLKMFVFTSRTWSNAFVRIMRLTSMRTTSRLLTTPPSVRNRKLRQSTCSGTPPPPSTSAPSRPSHGVRTGAPKLPSPTATWSSKPLTQTQPRSRIASKLVSYSHHTCNTYFGKQFCKLHDSASQ